MDLHGDADLGHVLHALAYPFGQCLGRFGNHLEDQLIVHLEEQPGLVFFFIGFLYITTFGLLNVVMG